MTVIKIEGNICIKCGKLLTTGKVCPIHAVINEHNARRKYMKHSFMFFGVSNKHTSDDLHALGLHFQHNSTIYVDMKRLMEYHPYTYIETLIFIFGHEVLHKTINKTDGRKASHMLDCKYMRELLDPYCGGTSIKIQVPKDLE